MILNVLFRVLKYAEHWTEGFTFLSDIYQNKNSLIHCKTQKLHNRRFVTTGLTFSSPNIIFKMRHTS